MSLKDNTVKGVLWSGIDTFGQYLIQFVVTILLARLLTPADFGLIEMLIIFSSISNILLDSGFGQALIRKKEVSNRDYSSVFFFNVLCAIILYGVLYFIAPSIAVFYKTPELTAISRIFFIVIILNAFVIIQNTLLSRALNFKLLAKASLLSSLLSGIIGVVLAIYGFGVWALVFQMIFHSFVRVILLWLFNTWKPTFNFSFNSIRELWAFSSKLMVNGLLDTFVTNLQSLVIGRFFTKTDLGLYSQAKKFQSLPSQTLTQIIQKVTYPVLSKIQDNDERLKQAYKKIIQVTTFVVFTVMLYLMAVADNLFFVVLSEKWMPAVEYFRPLCIIGILHPLQSINVNIFLVKGRSGLMLKLSLIRRILVVLSLVIAIKFGILALVWSLVFTYVFTGIIFISFAGRLINYTVLEQIKDVFPTFVIASLLSLATYFIGIYVLNSSELVNLLFQTVFFYILFVLLVHISKINSYIEIRTIIESLLKKKKYNIMNVKGIIKTTLKYWVLRYCMHSVLLYPLNNKILRPRLWRLIGCKVGKNVFIGYDVYIDIGNTNLITIEEGAYIANRSLILCHVRDLKNYRINDKYGDLPYRKGEVKISKGACVGMGAIILPGVTVGEGAIVGAGSVVSKDVPAWTIVTGVPAVVTKQIRKRTYETENN